MMTRIRGWKTIALNGGLVLLALAAELFRYLAVFDWSAIVSPMWLPYVVLAVNCINIVLRVFTTTSIFRAEDEGKPE